MIDKMFVVTAYRYGDKESHSYVVGVFSVGSLALEAAEEEEDYRGGKYSCEVLRMTLNGFREKKEIIRGI